MTKADTNRKWTSTAPCRAGWDRVYRKGRHVNWTVVVVCAVLGTAIIYIIDLIMDILAP